MYGKQRKVLIILLLIISAVDVALQLMKTPWVWAWNALYWAVLTSLNFLNFKVERRQEDDGKRDRNPH